MARCPKCGKLLPDAWLRKAGATLLGQAGGESKARSLAVTQRAAEIRWKKARKRAAPKETKEKL